MPREPYQRCAQSVFEAWLKPKLQENPMVDDHFGWKLDSLTESSEGVESTIIDVDGKIHKIHSEYVIGCDGAGSKIRHAINSKLEGGPA
jgi:2-polyprenyl-6-methoxyphenol hydroxylase-like FAD-dependent oxidoreductase